MGDYSVMWQQSRPSKFLDQENVVLSYYAKWDAAPGGSTFGFVRAQIGYWDNTTETVNGFDVPTSGSNMTTSYQRFYIITTLPVWTRNATTVCITKIGAIAQPNTTGKVRITMPMVNGGRLGAQWTSVMNPGDVNGGIIPGGTGGGGGFDPNQKPSNCVVGETLIYTPKGHVPIRDLRPGHEVYSVVGKRLVRNQIVQIHESQTATTRRITTPSGSLECTFRHPIGVKKANLSFQKASGFNVGEFLFAMNGHGLKTEEILLIEDLVQYDKYIPVYHLSLKKNPKNYITNGVVSHNRKPDP
jgi:hypothetical protein